MTFTRAFTQFPWCSPSRQSFLSGRRPDTTKSWTFTVSFRDALPNATSLPQFFRSAGYHTVSTGKIFHGRNCVRGDPGCCPANATFAHCVQQPQDADWLGGNGSWDEHPVDFGRVVCPDGAQWCESAAPETSYADHRIAMAAVERIQAHKSRASGKPLFLAVGFRDDHLPWASPKRFRDLFTLSNITTTRHAATPDFARTGIHKVAWQYPSWVGPHYNLSNATWLEPPQLREAMLSYLANIAWTDSRLGLVLKAMDDVGYTNDTITLFVGDHGQNLGEHNTWTKMTDWEHSLRVPLIIGAPWLTAAAGRIHDGMADMRDIYRTLGDLAGLDMSSLDKGVEGQTLGPVLRHPAGAEPKPYAFSQTQRVSIRHLRHLLPYARLPRGADDFYAPSCFSDAADLEWMGYSVRSAQWRYTEWYPWDRQTLRPVVNSSALVELYNHTRDTTPFDPDAAEFSNVIQRAGAGAIARELQGVLRQYVATGTAAA